MGALAGGLLTASRPAAYPTWSPESDAPLLSAVTHARDARLDSRSRSLLWCRPPKPTDLVRSQKKPRGFEKLEGTPVESPRLTRAAAAMEPRRSKRIKLSKEGDFGVLLGALMRDVPDLFEAEVLSKLDVKDHFRLAQVNKECRDVVYKLRPVEFMRSCDVGDRVAQLGSRRRVAVVEGRLDVLKWLWKHDGPCFTFRTSLDEAALEDIFGDLYFAGLHGHKHVLDWYFTLPRDGLVGRLVQHLDDFEGACNGAAQGGKLELLKHLREKGSIFSATTCAMAAGTGQLHVVKWLRENGCPWDENTPSAAAYNGHLSTVKWAHENGCPWDADTCSAAAAMGRIGNTEVVACSRVPLEHGNVRKRR